MIKKMFGTVLVAAALLLSSVSSVGAYPYKETLTLQGHDSISFPSYLSNTKNGVMRYSHDGIDYVINIYNHYPYRVKPGQQAYLQIELWEYDANGPDDFVGKVRHYPQREGSKTYTFKLTKLDNEWDMTDELYFKYKSNYSGKFVSRIYD